LAGNGKHPPLRKPTKGEYGEVVKRMQAEHPELSKAEAEARALTVYQGGLQP